MNPNSGRVGAIRLVVPTIDDRQPSAKGVFRAKMIKQEKIDYWLKSAEYDWMVAGHLFEKGDYAYSLFFGHLTIEKILKAIFVSKFDEHPPFTHRLTYLAEKMELVLSPEKHELLEIITDFNLESRYPDEKFSFYKRCTKEFAGENIKKIEEIRGWLLQQAQ
ncbi:MAG: HEPN domain-containing protein [Deltaproteobacteria bacterium]|nr:HEPN domain-containing protein [Deltaproteobacteria bacterium]